MRNIQVKLGLRLNKRVSATIVGVAICVTYLVGTIAMVEGLDVATKRVTGMFEYGSFVVYNGNSLSQSLIERSAVDKLSDVAFCTLLKANVSGVRTRIIAVEDKNNVLGFGDIDGRVLIGKELVVKSKNITVAANGKTINLSSAGGYSSELIPNNWVIVPREAILKLCPEFKDKFSFLVVPSTNLDVLRALNAEGFTVQETVGVVRFFEEGIYQVERNLWGILIFSALIIFLLVYSIMSVEIRYRYKDIKVLRALGAKRTSILSIFLVEALFISFSGGMLGVALGIIAANALISFSPLLGFKSMVVPQVTFYSISLPLGIATFAGFIGGIYPAAKASKIEIKRLGTGG